MAQEEGPVSKKILQEWLEEELGEGDAAIRAALEEMLLQPGSPLQGPRSSICRVAHRLMVIRELSVRKGFFTEPQFTSFQEELVGAIDSKLKCPDRRPLGELLTKAAELYRQLLNGRPQPPIIEQPLVTL